MKTTARTAKQLIDLQTTDDPTCTLWSFRVHNTDRDRVFAQLSCWTSTAQGHVLPDTSELTQGRGTVNGQVQRWHALKGATSSPCYWEMRVCKYTLQAAAHPPSATFFRLGLHAGAGAALPAGRSWWVAAPGPALTRPIRTATVSQRRRMPLHMRRSGRKSCSADPTGMPTLNFLLKSKSRWIANVILINLLGSLQ